MMPLPATLEAQSLHFCRMAENMLRDLGGVEVRILRAAAPQGSEQQRQLGIAGTACRDVAIFPAVVQPLKANMVLFLLPGSVISAKAEEEGELDGAAWLASSRGIENDGTTRRVLAVQEERFGDAVYLYRVTAGE